ncbi:hypothetical protein TBLA_0A08060 [Henningerozyma blattae CBS 6284]|uniref:Bms1-type G domain-containing protein n=1 Tax=Henningerozyma blattae (strain ATCC 34711 / CBS 6284 / DSM 70876 / NBRC 10599 / NRRL Y-10934 / UCD 77-7) TaxID=1071380 RepID=I2GWU4_HENB6|nr:hypothetical protein TBLA_0A08060 [Tetrapisispora blattae CBS 6284]CCH58596.1 hypothetical protein TBLA_0A08060 [Tetrapisispora blattae CBS 6284]
MAGHSHRSSIKNGHKGFKSKHSSKGALKRLHKGKVEKDIKTGKSNKISSKLQRKNKSKQLRLKKIMDTLEVRKLFEGSSGAEKIITIIPLTPDIDAGDIVSKLLAQSSELSENDLDSLIKMGNSAFIKDFHIKKFKSTLKIIVPDMSNFLNVLDCAKVADIVVFGLSGTSEVDQEFGEQVIRALELQGIASYIGVVPNLSKVHPKEKFQLDVKQSLESYFKHFFPNEDRIYNLEKPAESLNALRILSQRFPRGVTWRDQRGYLLADQIDFVEISEDAGQLVVQGTVRGIGFNANRLVHIPGLGDFQVEAIERISASGRSKKNNTKELDLDLQNVFQSNDNRETLDEYIPYDAEMEDWSDYGEDFQYDNLTAARYDEHGYLPRSQQEDKIKRVPKGTSKYQAMWYLNDVIEVSDDEEIEEEEDIMVANNNNEDEQMYDDMAELSNVTSKLGTQSDAQTDGPEEIFEDLSPEEEERQWMQYKSLEKDDLDFPDEIELNPNESAIERLMRYRGLKNLHNCVWDYDEKDPEKPAEWNRLLRIGNYKNTKAKLNKEAINDAQVVAGDRAKISINFPKVLLEKIGDPSQLAFVIYGLLSHEHKNAMVNFSIQRWEEYENPVPSEEQLIVQYGARRYIIRPQFSSASNTSNNVHKYERFLHPDTISIATCMAPVDFTQSPAIFFKPKVSDVKGLELVGFGSFLNTDHTRILAKRAVLTGHPFRFHKSVLTVRYMFFRPEDVEWFKSIPLFTKTGRSGFIKESLGTHGYFKATFDAKLSAQDVVAMSLFKRMWPLPSLPWST